MPTAPAAPVSGSFPEPAASSLFVAAPPSVAEVAHIVPPRQATREPVLPEASTQASAAPSSLFVPAPVQPDVSSGLPTDRSVDPAPFAGASTSSQGVAMAFDSASAPAVASAVASADVVAASASALSAPALSASAQAGSASAAASLTAAQSLRQRSVMASEALSELSALSADSPQAGQQAAAPSRRSATGALEVPGQGQHPAEEPLGARRGPRNAADVRSMLSGARAGGDRGNAAGSVAASGALPVPGQH